MGNVDLKEDLSRDQEKRDFVIMCYNFARSNVYSEKVSGYDVGVHIGHEIVKK